MKVITPEMVRQKCIELGIPHRQVWGACNLNSSWFNKMMGNEKHSFIEPNPEWMELIWRYLNAYESFYKGIDKDFQKYWKRL